MHSGRKSCPDSLRSPLSFRVYVRTFPQMQSGAPVVSPNRNHAPISRKVAVSVVRQAFFRVFRMSFFEEEGVPGAVRWSAFLSCFRMFRADIALGAFFATAIVWDQVGKQGACRSKTSGIVRCASRFVFRSLRRTLSVAGPGQRGIISGPGRTCGRNRWLSRRVAG